MALATARAKASAMRVAHLLDGAVAWADIACSLSSDAAEDVIALAQAYLLRGESQRAALLLQRTCQAELSLSGRYLLAQAHAADEQWERVLDVLGRSDAEAPTLLLAEEEGTEDHDVEVIPNAASAVCVLRAKAHERLDNREDTVKAYTDALRHDPLCIEAFQSLTARCMLTPEQKSQLFESLDWSTVDPEARAMTEYLYSSSINKYKAAPDAEENTVPASLLSNRELRVQDAERLYLRCRFRECYKITTSILDEDAFHSSCLPLHVACQVELKDTNNLFYLAHRLVDASPKSAVAWFAVGCYYHSIRKAEEARRYLSKSAQLDVTFGPAWIAFGHAFAVEGEHDQAMSAYSTAARLLPGSHLPLLYIGMAQAQMNNLPLAARYLERAMGLCADDPSIFHELGVVHIRSQNFEEAVPALEKAVTMITTLGEYADKQLEPSLVALGRAYHKAGRYNEAEETYRRALAIAPSAGDTHAGLAYVYHTRRQFEKAVESYHEALSLNPHDSFSSQMLDIALEQLVT